MPTSVFSGGLALVDLSPDAQFTGHDGREYFGV